MAATGVQMRFFSLSVIIEYNPCFCTDNNRWWRMGKWLHFLFAFHSNMLYCHCHCLCHRFISTPFSPRCRQLRLPTFIFLVAKINEIWHMAVEAYSHDDLCMCVSCVFCVKHAVGLFDLDWYQQHAHTPSSKHRLRVCVSPCDIWSIVFYYAHRNSSCS